MSAEPEDVSSTQPDDVSGRRARSGYRYQDLCALRYCILISLDDSWREVWCESHDDLVLYRRDNDKDRYRFVQVKYRINAVRHWSCADLCQHKSKKETIHDSILGKLFGKDRFSGESDFCLATNEGVDDDLRAFHYRWGHSPPTVDLTSKGATNLRQRFTSWKSPRKRPFDDYLGRFLIEQHAADIEDMEFAVLLELAKLLKRQRVSLFADELEAVFERLYLVVYCAASAELDQPGHPERIAADTFRESATASARAVASGKQELSETPPSETLRSQLRAIGCDDALIQTATELRQGYYWRWRRNVGTQFGEKLDEIYQDLAAICLEETLRGIEEARTQGLPRLLSVLQRVEDYHATKGLQNGGITLGLMHGMVYFLISRGSLRLT